MKPPFDTPYAALYDLVYREKNYAAECDLIETLFRTHCQRAVRTILDLGCGTGSHALELSTRGYRVVGVDRSDAMLNIARRKAERAGLEVDLLFRQGDIRSFRSAVEADAVLMMFAVLGYLATADELAAALATVDAHLRTGGLFAFDVWYAPAVESQRPSRRTRILQSDATGELLRVVSGALDPASRTCQVTIEIEHRRDDSTSLEASEVHSVRYFDQPELERHLASAGLELLSLSAFPSMQQPPDESTWNVLGVARKR